MFDPTAATSSSAGASRPSSSRRAWLPLLQPLMLLACFLLTLVVFSCPDPLSASSGITLLTVRPYNMTETTVSNGAVNSNSTSSSAGSTIVFGGANATTSTATTSPVNATGAASATTNASTSATAASTTSTADPATATSNRTLAASPAVAANESAAPAPASTASTANEPSKRSFVSLLPRTNYQPLNISSSSSRSPPAQLERVTDDPLDTHGSLNNGTSASNSSSSSPSSVSITTSPATGESLSLLELKYGPLGSCFRTWSGARACTPASLKPSYDASHLTLKALGGFDTSGLPTTLKTTPALLVACISLLAALALSSGLAAGARLFPGTKLAAPLLQAGAAQRAWGTMQRAALWLRLGVALLLLGTAVSMRLVVSKAAYAFNASNAAKSIGAAYLTPSAATAAAGQHATGGATQIGLQAVAGKGFGLLWATVLMLLIDFFLERRRLRREEAVAVARADLEAAWGREAVAMANLGKGASVGKMKRSKKVKVAQPQDSDDDDDIEGDEEEQVKPAPRRRSFFWPTSPRLSRPRKVARKAVPSYKGGLAPVLGPLFNPAPAPAPVPVQAMPSKAPSLPQAGGQGAVYIVQDKGSGGRQAAPQPQRMITRNDYHYHHHHQQVAPSRKGSMSSASMSSCSGAAAAPHAYYHQYGPAPRPQQQQQVAALPFESTAGGLASPPWASSTQMQHQQQQQQQQYGQSFTAAVAATTTQGATLPVYRSRDPLVAPRAPAAAAPFGQYATYDDEDDEEEDEDHQQQLAQPWRLKPGQHLLHRRASIDSPRSLGFSHGRRAAAAVASDDGHARLPVQQSQHQRSHSLNHHHPDAAPFASWKTKEAFELQAAPVHRAGARPPPAPAPYAGSSGTGSRSNSPYPPRVMRARRMSTSGESVGSMRSATGMGIGLRYVRS